jgi:hypothetical protein
LKTHRRKNIVVVRVRKTKPVDSGSLRNA